MSWNRISNSGGLVEMMRRSTHLDCQKEAAFGMIRNSNRENPFVIRHLEEEKKKCVKNEALFGSF